MEVAIVGASGAVDQESLHILTGENSLIDSLVLFGSERPASRKYTSKGRECEVKLLQHNDGFKDTNITLTSAGGDTSAKFAETITKYGAVMINNSGQFHQDNGISLVIPGINAEDALNRPRGIITNPNCTIIMMVVVLNPTGKLSHIKKTHVSSCQSTSGADAAAMAELQQQYKELVETDEVKTIEKFPHQLTYNVIPQIDKVTENDYTEEEVKMFNETRKVIHSDARTSAACIHVSSLCSHSETIWFGTKRSLSVEGIHEALKATPGVTVIDDPQNYVYPMPLESAGHDDIYVGRIRKGLADDNGNALWLTGSQTHKGAALNVVQITEYLIKAGDVK